MLSLIPCKRNIKNTDTVVLLNWFRKKNMTANVLWVIVDLCAIENVNFS